MAKFVKFKIENNTAIGNPGGDLARDVLVNVDHIENIEDNITGGGAYTVIVTLRSGLAQYASTFADGTATSVAGRILTLKVSKSSATLVNPDAVTVKSNMPSQSIVRALTANPGGVAATAQLALDGGGVRGTDDQMYWNSAVFSTDNTL